jgi:hypothetical protein
MMRTPQVVAAARRHFGCDSLTGVLLEEQNPEWMRWERRQINFEVLGSGFSVPTAAPVLSSLTVAAFMDMGFYQVDAALAAEVTQVLGWGMGMGCAFAQGCTSSSWPDVFCSSGSAIGYDRTFWGRCAVVTYDTLDPAYQHFSDALLGGADPFADYCPYLAKYSGAEYDASAVTMCTSSTLMADTVGALDSSAVCASCRAVTSNLVNNSYVAAGNTTSGPPRCMDVLCVNTTHVAVRVGQRYLTCKTGDRTVFTFPPAHPSYAPPVATAGTTYWTDYVYNGAWDCPQPSYMCQAALGSNAPYRSSGITLTAALWPEIVELDPPHGVVTGDETITVRGRRLFQKDGTLPISCRGLWIGGVGTVFETYTSLGTNASTGLDVFTVNTTALPQAYSDGSGSATSYVGGSADDGSGVVDVALLCKIPDVLVCSNEVDGGFSDGYCAISTIKGAFTYTSIPPTPPGTYFLSDGTNQAIIIAVFAVVMVGITTLIYFYCRSTYRPPDGVTLAKLHQDEESDNETSNSELNMQLLADMANAAEDDQLL